MSGIRCHKKWIMIIITWLLLSLFDTSMQQAAMHAVQIKNMMAQSRSIEEKEALCADVSEIPKSDDRFISVENRMDEIFTRKEKNKDTVIRFIAIVFCLLCAIQIEYRTTIRHYGYRMIPVWENISYIHRIDGEREIHLLWHETIKVLKAGGISCKKIEYMTGLRFY